MEGWNYSSTFYFLVKNSRKYVKLCEKVAILALKDTKGAEIWLEASTERSKSNPGRSLGIYRAYSACCLEDSTQLICSFTFGSVRTRSKGSRITLIRRIFKPSPTPPWRDFSLVTDCQLETQVASARPFIPKGGQEGGLIREKNRSVASGLSVIYF